MDSLIVKQLHPHLHIPAAFCILKSSRAEHHCKIEGFFSRSPRKNAEEGRIVISLSSLETSSYDHRVYQQCA